MIINVYEKKYYKKLVKGSMDSKKLFNGSVYYKTLRTTAKYCTRNKK